MPPFGGSPYSPGPEDQFDYRPGSAITDLILRAGDVRAQQQMRSGDIWGQTVAGLGQMAGQAIGDIQAQKAKAKQEAAWSEYLDSGDWAQNPLEAYKAANSIWGSEQGAQHFEGLMAVQKLAKGEIKDPQKAQEYLGYAARTAAGMSDEMLGKYWPVLRAAAQGGGLGDIGESYTPEFRPQIESLAKAFNAQKPGEGFTLGRGQVRFGPEGQKIAEGLPEEPPKPIAVGGSLVTPTGEVIYQAPEKPAGAGSRSWVLRNGDPVRVSEAEIQPGDVPYESPKAAQKKMPAGSATELADMQTGLDQSAELRKKLAGGTAGAWDRLGAAVDTAIPGVTKATGWGQDAKNQQAVIGLVKQIIGKSLEGGVLRKEDEIKYTHMIPVLGDSDETVKTKLDTMDTAIKNKRDNQLAGLSDAGYDTSKFEERLGPSAVGAPTKQVGIFKIRPKAQ